MHHHRCLAHLHPLDDMPHATSCMPCALPCGLRLWPVERGCHPVMPFLAEIGCTLEAGAGLVMDDPDMVFASLWIDS